MTAGSELPSMKTSLIAPREFWQVYLSIPQVFLFQRMLMKVFNGSTPCVDRIKQSNWNMNNSAVVLPNNR